MFLYFSLEKNRYERDCTGLVLYYLNYHYLYLNKSHIINMSICCHYVPNLRGEPLTLSGERKSLRKSPGRQTGSRNGVEMEPRKEHWYIWLWQIENAFGEINQQKMRGRDYWRFEERENIQDFTVIGMCKKMLRGRQSNIYMYISTYKYIHWHIYHSYNFKELSKILKRSLTFLKLDIELNVHFLSFLLKEMAFLNEMLHAKKLGIITWVIIYFFIIQPNA